MALISIYRIVLLGFVVSASALAVEPSERREILDAIRPIASEKAGQPVRIKVERINQDRDWVILIGSLVAPPGKTIDWELAENCHPDNDKMLWVVLQRKAGWSVKHIEICAPEPPYWDIGQYGGFIWPCGVYAGLETADVDGDGVADNLERQCRKENAPYRRKKRGLKPHALGRI